MTSELILFMKKLFPIGFKFSPGTIPEMVLKPFPVQEDVPPILFWFEEFAYSSMLWYVLDDPLKEFPFNFNSA